MGFSALFLSKYRLVDVVDLRTFVDARGATTIRSFRDDGNQVAAVIKSLTKATDDWIEKKDLPTLDKLIETGELTSGTFFTHGGPFCAKDIVEGNRQFFQEKPLTANPILQAELTSADGSNLILEVPVHPENYITDSAADMLTRTPSLFMVGCLVHVVPPNLIAQAYAIGFRHDQSMGDDDALDQKSVDPYLSDEERLDYKKFEYQCRDWVFIPGSIPMGRSNFIEVNGHKTKIGDSLLKLFLRFVVELKKNKGGWVNVITLKEEDVITNEQGYQQYNLLRDKLQGYLLKKDAKKFIQNDGSNRYRISTHPDFITYEKKKLIKHPDPKIRELTEELL
ncbi:MAG: hypothetical protein KOO63_10470 [Bacteroidales bacterium]|nr:hypothetical protein [Candidatus Latescibacterota bacterium]